MSLTCVEGKADVRSVSCVSSIGRRRGTLSTNAAWSGVAAHAVMRKPARARARVRAWPGAAPRGPQLVGQSDLLGPSLLSTGCVLLPSSPDRAEQQLAGRHNKTVV